MPGPVALLDDIQHRLDALARRHRVPGATLAVSAGDELADFATGVLSTRTRVPVTPDSVFQIGSNTKLMTTTLIMQLADAGEVELDAPARRYLPEFTLASPGADQITVRHLLTHSSGIEGDHFADYGRGDEAVGRYVASLAGIGLAHPPGRLWSYCNSGFVVAGAIVEKLTGLPWHQALRERICQPLGLRQVAVLAEDMVAQRCAVGHVEDPGGDLVVPPTVVMPMSTAPAGSRTVATAAELVGFVRAHLAGGLNPDGSALLSPESTRAMQEVQRDRPSGNEAPAAQGLGWLMSTWDGEPVIGHGGGTVGQTSFLEAIPGRDLVVVLLTNSDLGGALWRDLARWLFDALAGLRLPRVPGPADPPPDLPLDRYEGTYERLGLRSEIVVADGGLTLRRRLTSSLAALREETELPPQRLRPVTRDTFRLVADGRPQLMRFLEFGNDGRPAYYWNSRVARRTS